MTTSAKINGKIVVLGPSRRRGASFRYAGIAPQQARPAALRELYMDAGSRIRRSAPATAPSSRS